MVYFASRRVDRVHMCFRCKETLDDTNKHHICTEHSDEGPEKVCKLEATKAVTYDDIDLVLYTRFTARMSDGDNTTACTSGDARSDATFDGADKGDGT